MSSFLHYGLLGYFLVAFVVCDDNEVIRQCCDKGRALAGDCGHFAVPVANISVEDQNLCIASMEICCIAAKREEACQKGQIKAKEDLSCEAQQLCTFDLRALECPRSLKMTSLYALLLKRHSKLEFSVRIGSDKKIV